MDLLYIENCIRTQNLDLIELDMNKVCRTCLTASMPDPSSIFSSTGVIVKEPANTYYNINEIVEKVAGIPIQQNDGLPSHICRVCIRAIYAAYNFKQQCVRIDTVLKSYVNAKGGRNTANGKIPPAVLELKTPPQLELLTPKMGVDTMFLTAMDHDPLVRGLINEKGDDASGKMEGLVVVHDDQEDGEDDESYQQNDLVILEVVEKQMAKRSAGKSRTSHKRGQSSSGAAASNNNSTSTTCKLCKGEFETVSALEAHRKTVHNITTDFWCKECQKSFSSNPSLSRHMNIHNNDPSLKHPCKYCEKTFTRSDDLRRHIRTHTNERPYPCTQCPKAFKQPSELKEHKRTHSGTMDFTCPICNKKIGTRNGLYVHKKIHANERNHECENCGKKYFTSWQLSRHNCLSATSSPQKMDVRMVESVGEREEEEEAAAVKRVEIKSERATIARPAKKRAKEASKINEMYL